MVSIVVGGQTGSESKGKTCIHIAQKRGCALAIRSGGPNAGHVCYFGNNRYVTRQLPSPLVVPGVRIAIAAGGMVDPNLLEQELTAIEEFGVKDIRERLWIDPMASVVEDDARDHEAEMCLNERLGSTQTGTGYTQSQRVLRKARIARDIMALRPHHRDVALEANKLHDQGKHVIIEGTQGFGLSLYHGGFYPQCTSRETSAAGFAAECGISPRIVSDIWMVIRTFPIRVAGNSGPIRNETTWDFIQRFSGRTEPLVEMTSVTKRVRRVGLFDWELLQRAIMINRPTHLAVHGLDYLNVEDLDKRSFCELSQRSVEWLRELAIRGKVPIGMAFTGPHQDSLIDELPALGAGDYYDGTNGRKVAGENVMRSALETQGD